MSTIINATTTNGVVIQPDNSGSLQLATNSGTTAVTIDTSQNVGIGTTSPVFATGGGLSIYNATAARIKLGDSTSGIGSLDGVELIYDDDAYLFNRENTALIFGTNNTERMRIDSSGNLRFNSGYGSVATAYGCRAWVNFDGTGTVAIRASGNVSSITDNGTGNYTVNFTTAMSDNNYTVSGLMTPSVSNAGSDTFAVSFATTSIGLNHYEAGILRDSAVVSCIIHR